MGDTTLQVSDNRFLCTAQSDAGQVVHVPRLACAWGIPHFRCQTIGFFAQPSPTLARSPALPVRRPHQQPEVSFGDPGNRCLWKAQAKALRVLGFGFLPGVPRPRPRLCGNKPESRLHLRRGAQVTAEQGHSRARQPVDALRHCCGFRSIIQPNSVPNKYAVQGQDRQTLHIACPACAHTSCGKFDCRLLSRSPEDRCTR